MFLGILCRLLTHFLFHKFTIKILNYLLLSGYVDPILIGQLCSINMDFVLVTLLWKPLLTSPPKATRASGIFKDLDLRKVNESLTYLFQEKSQTGNYDSAR